MSLTVDQRAAITARSSIAVTAGAGTGKTHLLAERYLFHLVEEGLSPLEVVAITFTRRAAAELRSRVRQIVAQRLPDRDDLLAGIEAAPITTIDSLCARICRDHPRESGVPASFEILNESSDKLISPDLINAALDRHSLDGVLPEIYESIPFSLLRTVLTRLLADPVTAEQAFASALQYGEDGEKLVELWAAIGRQATESEFERLINGAEWADSISTLKSHAGRKGDTIEELRRRVLELTMTLTSGAKTDLAGRADLVEQIGSFNLRGGSVKGWPDGGFDTVKAALKCLRAIAREIETTRQVFTITATDLELARIIPLLNQAFNYLQASLRQARTAARLIDYAGVEAGARRAVQSDKVCDYYRRRWRAFLIDEFQDTSQIQADIIERLTAEASLTIVGDENQSIYGFRRAEVAVFRQFSEKIVNSGGSNHQLTISFRSHAALTGILNRVFETVQPDEHRHLEALRDVPPAGPPYVRFLSVETVKGSTRQSRQQREAGAIASIIRQMLDERLAVHDRLTGLTRPITPADIAILSRTWHPLEIFGEALAAVNIPSTNMGGGDLLRTREALDQIALIRFLANPGDDLALVAILRSPFFAISDLQLQIEAEQRVKEAGWWSHLATSSAGEIRHAAAILQSLLDRRGTESPEMLLRLADRLTGYSAVLAGLPNARRRLADWQAFLDWVRDGERTYGGEIFPLWRRLKRLIDCQVSIPRPPLEAGESVSMLTIHSAKGLEWPVVIVPDLSFNRMPSRPAVHFDPQVGIALSLQNNGTDETDVSQESEDDDERAGSLPVLYSWLAAAQKKREAAELRRLLYVAMTRARDRVVLSAPDLRGDLPGQLIPGLENAGILAETIPFHRPPTADDSTDSWLPG